MKIIRVVLDDGEDTSYQVGEEIGTGIAESIKYSLWHNEFLVTLSNGRVVHLPRHSVLLYATE